MLSKFVLSVFIATLKIGRLTGGSTIKICNRTVVQYSIDTELVSSVRRNFLKALIWQVLAVLLILKYWILHDSDNLHLTISWWLGYSLLLLVFSISRFNADEQIAVANGLNQFFDKMKRKLLNLTLEGLNHVPFINFLMNLGKFMPWFNPTRDNSMFKLLDYSVLYLNACCLAVFLFGMVLVIWKPRGLIFLGGLIPETYFYWPVAFLIMYFHIHLFAAMISSLAATLSLTIVYCIYVYFFITREFRFGRSKYVSRNGFRTFPNLMLFYRGFQVLHTCAMISCKLGVYLMIAYGVVLAAEIYMSFVLIVYWNELKILTKGPMVIALTAVVIYWAFLLEIGCLFQVGGNKTLNSWKKQGWGKKENKLMVRLIWSCKPLVLSYGNQFVIGRTSLLSFHKGLIRGVCRTLLTTK